MLPNNQRVMMTQLFADVMTAASTVVKNIHDPSLMKTLEKIRPYIPKLVSTFRYSVSEKKEQQVSIRYFTYIDSKCSGKNRIYMSSEEGKQDLFIFYLSKDRLRKMFRDQIDESIINSYANKWIITSGQYRFKDVYKLIFNTIAVERFSSKKNHPPASNEPNNWTYVQYLVNKMSRHTLIKSKYSYMSVYLQQYEFVRECERILW